MITFSVGDIVTCIDDYGIETLLTKNKDYTVKNFFNTYGTSTEVVLDGVDGCFYPHRFRLKERQNSPFQQWERGVSHAKLGEK